MTDETNKSNRLPDSVTAGTNFADKMRAKFESISLGLVDLIPIQKIESRLLIPKNISDFENGRPIMISISDFNMHIIDAFAKKNGLTTRQLQQIIYPALEHWAKNSGLSLEWVDGQFGVFSIKRPTTETIGSK